MQGVVIKKGSPFVNDLDINKKYGGYPCIVTHSFSKEESPAKIAFVHDEIYSGGQTVEQFENTRVEFPTDRVWVIAPNHRGKATHTSRNLVKILDTKACEVLYGIKTES